MSITFKLTVLWTEAWLVCFKFKSYKTLCIDVTCNSKTFFVQGIFLKVWLFFSKFEFLFFSGKFFSFQNVLKPISLKKLNIGKTLFKISFGFLDIWKIYSLRLIWGEIKNKIKSFSVQKWCKKWSFTDRLFIAKICVNNWQVEWSKSVGKWLRYCILNMVNRVQIDTEKQDSKLSGGSCAECAEIVHFILFQILW